MTAVGDIVCKHGKTLSIDETTEEIIYFRTLIPVDHAVFEVMSGVYGGVIPDKSWITLMNWSERFLAL